ncbi:hypothetical protein SAMN05192550_2747 [Flavobacterium glycines]|uniref:Uncharacterized protein n=1 Tax=Flavobacterium glycines TaxID=551990 RepID=A0A1B9DL26_9FLAO|nr:hypothetical protein FBGL_12670 [Flavobacterium glycines]GEL11543.1 hypothetical protein FGL01_22820 [Flavobacterium glycines]SDJ75631.1 hypothetical protein SAMN05192550_2747 [Flavobacterium glycines]
MKTIKIIDCNNNEQNLNVDKIYNVSSYEPGFKQPAITEISLHEKDDTHPFAVFKTYESVNSLLLRLEACR